jgi:hypothetical protein
MRAECFGLGKKQPSGKLIDLYLQNARSLLKGKFMSGEKRQKASDVFRDSTYVFSQKTSFAKAFPSISHTFVKVVEVDGPEKVDFNNPPGYPAYCSSLDESSLGEFIDCSNRVCYGGGFSIGTILREMVATKEVQREGSTGCQGYEGSPKGKHRHRSCLHRFHYQVTIEYNV